MQNFGLHTSPNESESALYQHPQMTHVHIKVWEAIQYSVTVQTCDLAHFDSSWFKYGI